MRVRKLFKLWESQTHRWVDVKDLKNKIEQQKSALKKMEETNKKLKAENEDLEERLMAISELYMNLLKYK